METREDPLWFWHRQLLDITQNARGDLVAPLDKGNLSVEEAQTILAAAQQNISDNTLARMANRISDAMYPVVIEQADEVERLIEDEFDICAALIAQCWGKALSLLKTFVMICIECGSENVVHLSMTDHNETALAAAMPPLHARCCQVAREVHLLCRRGYADGAHARWRTLYELSIVGQFLKQHGELTATRYMEHGVVSARRAARSHAQHHERLGETPPSSDELSALEERCRRLQEKYGRPFLTSYGWAAEVLNNKNPKFWDLEKSVGLSHWRPYYYLANLNVHGDVRGNRFRLGNPSDASRHLAGPSYLGLADPIHGSALSLMWITFSILGISPTMDVIVRQKILARLHDEIRDEVSLAHSRSIEMYRERYDARQDDHGQ